MRHMVHMKKSTVPLKFLKDEDIDQEMDVAKGFTSLFIKKKNKPVLCSTKNLVRMFFSKR